VTALVTVISVKSSGVVVPKLSPELVAKGLLEGKGVVSGREEDKGVTETGGWEDESGPTGWLLLITGTEEVSWPVVTPGMVVP